MVHPGKPELHAKAVELRKAGYSIKQIADELHAAKSSVWKWVSGKTPDAKGDQTPESVESVADNRGSAPKVRSFESEFSMKRKPRGRVKEREEGEEEDEENEGDGEEDAGEETFLEADEDEEDAVSAYRPRVRGILIT